MAGNAVQQYVGRAFRRIITADPDGVPPWLEEMRRGSGKGLYGPEDAPWIVHADFATLVGGVRALLMQTLHPGTLAGVAQHSRYEADALGRLAGTTKWLTISTFGSMEAIEHEAQRVNALHERVRGTYINRDGETVEYAASNEDLLGWVHIAFTESFLVAHQTYSARPIPGGADEYVRDWARSVEPLGLFVAPRSEPELREAIQELHRTGVLQVSEKTFKVVKFLRRPPLHRTALIGYTLLFAAAVVTLPPEFRRMLGLPNYPRWLVVPITRTFLRILRIAVGPESPIEDAARERINFSLS
jgi:uncharacterized protein (DUF2236 family)